MAAPDNGGGAAEEAIRTLFREMGYFAVRGVRFRFDKDDATDIDVWAYGRGSPTHRERVVVDCKYKLKGAQGFERLFWVEGLRRFAGVEHAVLATTDGRESLRSAAARMHVRVVGPSQFADLVRANSTLHRLTEEEYLREVVPTEDKLVGRVREQRETAKSRLLRLDWDSANSYIEDIRRYATDTVRLNGPQSSVRLVYETVANFLITLDFNVQDALFDPKHIANRIDEGLRYGARGRAGTLAHVASLDRKSIAAITRAAEALRTDIPTEFFARHAGTAWLLDVACMLESAAFSRDFVPVSDLPPDAQAAIGILLDFLGIDRRVLFSVR